MNKVGLNQLKLLYGCFPKIGIPPNHPLKNRVFHYKSSILGYHYFWKHPYCQENNIVNIPESLASRVEIWVHFFPKLNFFPVISIFKSGCFFFFRQCVSPLKRPEKKRQNYWNTCFPKKRHKSELRTPWFQSSVILASSGPLTTADSRLRVSASRCCMVACQSQVNNPTNLGVMEGCQKRSNNQDFMKM